MNRLFALILIAAAFLSIGSAQSRNVRWRGTGALAGAPATCWPNRDVYYCSGTGCSPNPTLLYCGADGASWVSSVPSGGSTPSGAAGGSLAGTYPNPTLAPAATANTCVSSGGSTTAYTCTAALAISTCATGLEIIWTADVTNTTTGPTLNAGCGVKNIVTNENASPTIGLIAAASTNRLRYDGTAWRLPAVVSSPTGATTTGTHSVTSTVAGTNIKITGLKALTHADSPYSVAATDGYILCDATAGVVTITLPAATGTGREITVKKTDSSTNACTPTRAGSDTIDGATTYSVTAQYASSKIVDAASASWHRSHVNQLGGDLSGISTNATVGSIGGKAVSLANSLTTAGNFALTLTQTGATNVTLPTSGTLISSIAPLVLGADVIEQYDGANAQAFYSYYARSDASNYTRMLFGWTSGIFHLETQKLGTGVFGSINIGSDAGGSLAVGANISIAGGSIALSSATVGIGSAPSAGTTLKIQDTTNTTGATRVSMLLGAADLATTVTLTNAGTIKAAGYQSSDGSAGVTGSTCTAWKNGLCVAN